MSDLCECVCEYIWAMGRVLSAIQTHTQCTDTECFTEHPGYEPGTGESGSNAMQLVLFVLVWMIIAVVMFLLRPSSLRGSTSEKPAPNRDGDRRLPPGGHVQ